MPTTTRSGRCTPSATVLTSGQCEGHNQEIARPLWLKVAGGQLHIRTAGSGPLAIFLHGWTLDWRIWLPQLPLARHMRIVLPDRRGFGCSTAPPNLVAEREDIEAIADHFGAEKLSLIGLSQGAAVALDFVRSHPERMAAAAVIGAPLQYVVPEPNNAPEIDRTAYSRLLRDGNLAEMLAEWQRHPLTKVSNDGQHLLDQILADYDGRDQMVDQKALAFSHSDIAGLAMPVLAIAGETDSPWRQQVAQFIGSNAPHGETEIIPNAGHIANLDQPETTNTLLEKFLSQHQKGN
jgi:pimeloyl-ACP methyl ester carboxylesterase